MSDFDPYRTMLAARYRADRDQLRITHWRVNYAALMEIARHPYTGLRYSEKPIGEREVLGIPFQLDHDDQSDLPALEPIFAAQGWPGAAIHDDQADHDLYFLNALAAVIDERKKMGLSPMPKIDSPK